METQPCGACGGTGTVPVRPERPRLHRGHAAVLDAVGRLAQQTGYPPTIREIAAACGLESTSTVQYHVNFLVARGYLLRTKGAARSLRVPPCLGD